jgi:hypothetical protein
MTAVLTLPLRNPRWKSELPGTVLQRAVRFRQPRVQPLIGSAPFPFAPSGDCKYSLSFHVEQPVRISKLAEVPDQSSHSPLQLIRLLGWPPSPRWFDHSEARLSAPKNVVVSMSFRMAGSDSSFPEELDFASCQAPLCAKRQGS